jgi:hypothetical protein
METTLAELFQPLLSAAVAVLAGVVAIYVPKLLNAFTARTGIEVNEAQRQVVLGAVATAAGVIETSLDTGNLVKEQVNTQSPPVRLQAAMVMDAVPTAAAHLGMTVDSVARMIVGRADTGTHPPQRTPVIVPSTVQLPVQPPFERKPTS